jgi:thioesterase domain-containing protein
MLGGHCVGGVVALEMARQLKNEGEEVGLLALIDTERPTWIRAFLANARLGFRRGTNMLGTISKIARGKNGPRSHALRELIQRKLGKDKARDGAVGATDVDFYQSKVGYRRMAYDHTLKPYPGKITLLVNERQYAIDQNMGWKWFRSGGLIVKKVPGDHHTMLTDHGKEFGATLSACLFSAAASTSRQNGGGTVG